MSSTTLAAESWIGRTREVTDEITTPAIRRLAALLDLELSPRPGDPVPPHWLGILFDDAAPQSRLGPDGHPTKGEFLPPIDLPRRMLAGRRLAFHAVARIGDALRRRTEIVAITPKLGRSGRLVFVGLRHTVTAGDRLIATEDQDIAYREAAGAEPAADRSAAPSPAAAPFAWSETLTPDPVLLFRYSALTFNGHRIHYDADYARDAEHYPALVVNGGLTTLLLLHAAARRHPAAMLARADIRTLHPLFAGRPMTLQGASPAADGTIRLEAHDAAGPALRIDAGFGA